MFFIHAFNTAAPPGRCLAVQDISSMICTHFSPTEHTHNKICTNNGPRNHNNLLQVVPIIKSNNRITPLNK
jgi:hypothetical protein